MKLRHFAAIGALTLVVAGSGGVSGRATQARIEIGTDTGAQSVRLALPLFPLEARPGGNPPETEGLTRTFNETLWNDLEFAGIFDMIGRSFYPAGSFGHIAEIVPEDWVDPAVDAQILAFGHAEIDGNGQFAVETHLWDVRSDFGNRELMGSGAGLVYRIELSEPGVRRVAHEIADRIVAELGGGVRGIARTQIAFVSDRSTRPEDPFPRKEIWVMDYDGYNPRQLTTLRSTALTPRWAPDGSRIAYTHMSDYEVDIKVISPRDRQGFAFPAFPGTTTTPAWSPDSSRIVFSSTHGEMRGQSDPELYIADANGGNLRRLTFSFGIDISPVWNPEGNRIAFISSRATVQPQLYIMDVEGGNLQQISDGGHADEPSWSPDGRIIAYAWQPPRGGTSDIWIHDLQTGRNIQLTQNAGFNERPSWSPDGRHIVFQSDRNGTMQLYSMLGDGSRVRQLTRAGNNESPAWSNYVAQ